MRKITVNLTPGGVALVASDKRLGFGGEHNAVTLCFAVDGEALAHFGNAEYFRVIVDGNYSDKLYLTENEVSYSVPQSVMNPPSVHCQLVGYIDVDGEPSLIAKSSVAELTVDFSEAPVSEIGVSNDVFEKAMAVCTNAADKAQECSQSAYESANKSEQASDFALQQSQSAELAASVAEQHKDLAKAYSEQANQCLDGMSGFANALKGSKTGAEVTFSDVSPLDHDIKVKLSGEGVSGGGLKKGELIDTVAEIRDESITEHDWVNENELGSFTLYNNYVPVDNRTDLYVNIPAFAGASAGLLVTNGTVYRTFYACSDAGGEVYCYIDVDKIYISYDGQTVIWYSIEENSKIIGVGCNGENFFDHSLDLYGCTFGSGVKLYRSGKNVLPFPYNGLNAQRGITFTDNGDGSLTLDGTNTTVDGGSVFYFMLNGSVTLSAGKYTQTVLGDEGCIITGVTVDNKNISFKSGLSNLTEATVFKHFYISTPLGATYNNVTIYPMLEKSTVPTEYEPPVEPIECVVNTDGTANVPSLYPTTRLYTDTEGVTIEAEYNRDINKAFAELTNALISLGGNV